MLDDAQKLGTVQAVQSRIPQVFHLAFPQRSNTARYLAIVASVAVPLFLVAAIIWQFVFPATMVPISDEWSMVEFVRKLDEGTLTFADLWGFHVHNEHRILASRVIGLAVIELTNWNRHVHAIVALAIVSVTAALLLRAAWWSIGPRKGVIFLVAPILALCFSLTRYENWMLPFTDKIPTALGVALTVWALAAPRVPPWRLALAIIGAVLASVSSSGGLLTWIVFALAVLSLGWRSLAVWSVAALAVIVPYMRDFPTGTLTRTYARTTFELPGLTDAIGFTLAYLGAPIGFPDDSRARFFGAFGLLLFAANAGYLVHSAFATPRERQTLLVWIGLAGFALLSGIAVLVGRSIGFGLDFAMVSRFHAFSSLWWIALLVLAVAVFNRVRRVRVLASSVLPSAAPFPARALIAINAAALIAASLGFIQANRIALDRGKVYVAHYRDQQFCVFDFERSPDGCLETFYAGQMQTVREGVAYLAERQLAFFAPVRFDNTVGVPAAKPGEHGRFRCRFASFDPVDALPASVPPDVIADVCGRVFRAEEITVLPPPVLGRPVETLCLPDTWDTHGDWRNLGGKRWCAVDWFDGDQLAAASLIQDDASFAVHAYADGSLDMFVDGQRMRRVR